jgi:hypothetical protein
VATKAKLSEPVVEYSPLEEQVRQRAYELYVIRGTQSGSEVDDWLQAEEQILSASGRDGEEE